MKTYNKDHTFSRENNPDNNAFLRVPAPKYPLNLDYVPKDVGREVLTKRLTVRNEFIIELKAHIVDLHNAHDLLIMNHEILSNDYSELQHSEPLEVSESHTVISKAYLAFLELHYSDTDPNSLDGTSF
jgi:hypothetical protein